ncbi:MAG: efflux RND transporter periplasmic adaptor subunit [Tidjanibacter sp.]|nr:efflux RND transporter periplasmic adaptor subunit [Tidjanibacter sp.]
MKCHIFTILPLLLALLSGGCKRHSATTENMPTPRVEVARVVSERVVVPMRFQTLLYSNYDATIQPRVSGYLLSKEFQKGMPVEQGQVLFRLDAHPIELEVVSNRAALASAKTALAEAENNYRRAVPLARIEAISQSALDQYKAAYASAQAGVELAASQLDESLLQLSYTTITSPISGIIDDTGATIGDWVGVGTNYSILASVSNIDEIGVHIPISFARYYRLREAQGKTGAAYDNSTLLSNIRLHLADGTIYPYEGSYSYTMRDAGDQSGSIVIVASFPNPAGELKVGQSAVVVADVGSPEGALLVPQSAVVQTLNKASVWVVDRESVVRMTPVVLGEKFGSHWVVESGLNGGEMVVTSGVQKLRSGTKVIATTPSSATHSNIKDNNNG